MATAEASICPSLNTINQPKETPKIFITYIIQDGGYTQEIFGVTTDKEEAVEVWRDTLRKRLFVYGYYITIHAYETQNGKFISNRESFNCVCKYPQEFNALLPLKQADLDAIQYNRRTPTPPPSDDEAD